MVDDWMSVFFLMYLSKTSGTLSFSSTPNPFCQFLWQRCSWALGFPFPFVRFWFWWAIVC
jgi:hypothetical protein